jgi:hypothetical protein
MWSNPGDEKNGINWMLHSGQVSEEDLALALVQEYYPMLRSFAFLLTLSEEKAGKAALQAITQAVERRHRFWNQVSLKAWILTQSYQIISRSGRKLGKRVLLGNQAKPATTDPDYMQKLQLRLRLEGVLAPGEIAYVFGISERQARNRLELGYLEIQRAVEAPPHPVGDHGETRRLLIKRQSAGLSDDDRERLDHRLRDCHYCLQYANRLEEQEVFWLERQPKPLELTGSDLEQVRREMHALLLSKKGRVIKRLPMRELLLTGVLALGLFFLGTRLEVFEAFDARPTPTNVPTPRVQPQPTPPLTLEGEEGSYYFYYTYDRDTETVEQIADLAGISVEAVEYINLGINYGTRSAIRLVAFQDDERFHPGETQNHLPPRLTASSPLEEILSRADQGGGLNLNQMTSSIYIEYGPSGFSGIPAVYLSLVGASGPDHWVLIREAYREKNTLSVIRADDMLFSRSDQREWFGARVTKLHTDLRQSFTVGLKPPERGTVRVAGEGIVADRQAILLEWTGGGNGGEGLERIWLDAITGQVLRYEVYGGPQGSKPQALYLVTHVFMDDELPDWLFFPGVYQGENLEALLYVDGLDDLVASLLRRGPHSGY